MYTYYYLAPFTGSLNVINPALNSKYALITGNTLDNGMWLIYQNFCSVRFNKTVYGDSAWMGIEPTVLGHENNLSYGVPNIAQEKTGELELNGFSDDLITSCVCTVVYGRIIHQQIYHVDYICNWHPCVVRE